MKEFGFDDSAPEILIEIEPYSNDTEMIRYTITDLAGIKNFTLQYKYGTGTDWTDIFNDEPVVGEPSVYSSTYQFRYKHEDTCDTGCGEGSYSLRINSTDILEQGSPWTNTNSIYDITSPVFVFTTTEDDDDRLLEVNDVVTIQWNSDDDDVADIESVKIKYCFWENIISGNNTQSWDRPQVDDGDTTSITILSSLEEGLYYFYPVLTDLAGNKAGNLSPEECKENERLALDKSKPVASLEPSESDTFAYNRATSISILSVSDNIELKRTVLWYAYSEEFDYNAPPPSFSGHTEIYSSESLSGKITTDDTDVFFNFTDGQGTYRFFLETDDNHTFTPTTEVEMTRIYSIRD